MIYYVETEGWVTEEWMLHEFVRNTEKLKEYELFKTALAEKTASLN